MEWILREATKELISSCGKYKIVNSGRPGGCFYAVLIEGSWTCNGVGYRDFIHPVKVGTLEECKGYEPGSNFAEYGWSEIRDR